VSHKLRPLNKYLLTGEILLGRLQVYSAILIAVLLHASARSSEYKQRSVPFDPNILNHAFPETLNNATIYAPIKEQAFFRSERALYGYYPRFNPSYVSFGLNGTAYLKYGSYIIEVRDSRGNWRYIDVGPTVADYVKNVCGFPDFQFDNTGQNDEVSIRFDKDGDIYLLTQVTAYLADGSIGAGLTLLLHSKDYFTSWNVYKLNTASMAYTFARFEKLDWNNQDCLNRPPVILLSTYLYPYPWASNYIIVAQKQSNGTLKVASPLKIADYAVPFGSHSGDGNQCISHGNQIFVIYGIYKNWPAIPANNPQYNMTFLYPPPGQGNSQTVYCRNGTPTFAVVYDINSKTLSAPTFVGWGGYQIDIHNFPALTVDSTGHLHAIINGHHNPFVYTMSVEPYNVSEWGVPLLVCDDCTYSTLNCDHNDTLYAVNICSRRGYVFELALFRKKAGQDWEPAKYLRTPYMPYYRVWTHKMAVDTITNKLYLSYYSQSLMMQLFLDDYNAYINTWRDRERDMLIYSNGAIPSAQMYETYVTYPSEMCTLVSDDGGDTWHLAVSGDFRHE
jgi:hypothetical protein